MAADKKKIISLKKYRPICSINIYFSLSCSQTEDPVWAQLFGAVDLVTRSVDIFSKYGVDKYLTAYGLVVDPQWRGCNVGKELLLARYLLYYLCSSFIF